VYNPAQDFAADSSFSPEFARSLPTREVTQRSVE